MAPCAKWAISALDKPYGLCIMTVGPTDGLLLPERPYAIRTTTVLKKLSPRMTEVLAASGIKVAPAGQVRAFRRFLADTITQHGNMAAAAPALGLDLSTLSRWCQLLEIERKTVRTSTARVVATAPE